MSFYDNGIKFECKKCGNCCNIEGYVFIFPEDYERLIEKSGFSKEELERTYLSSFDGYTVFRDGGLGACIFWDPIVKGCKIYEARPTQCRTFPFWKTLLYKKAKWETETTTCEGIGSGKLFTFEEIEEIKKKL